MKAEWCTLSRRAWEGARSAGNGKTPPTVSDVDSPYSVLSISPTIRRGTPDLAVWRDFGKIA